MFSKIKILIFTIAATCCLFTFTNHVMGQGFSIGLRAGVNLATIYMPEEDGPFSSTTSPTFGILHGFAVNFGINKKFSIQPEILHSQQGTKLFLRYGMSSMNASVRWNYITLPILAKMTFGAKKTKVFVTAGPNIGYLLGGSSTLIALRQTIPYSSNDLENFNRVDAGINLGTSISLGVGPGNLNLDFRYGVGLTDTRKIIGPRPDKYKTSRNGVFSVSLAYLFNLGSK